jgi:hypothetical protein
MHQHQSEKISAGWNIVSWVDSPPPAPSCSPPPVSPYPIQNEKKQFKQTLSKQIGHEIIEIHYYQNFVNLILIKSFWDSKEFVNKIAAKLGIGKSEWPGKVLYHGEKEYHIEVLRDTLRAYCRKEAIADPPVYRPPVSSPFAASAEASHAPPPPPAYANTPVDADEKN